jgi:hypothetical protein
MGNLERKLKFTPKSYPLIEKTAAQLACVWYEVGRSQGMTSKWKTPRAYAKANLEKWIPKALEHLMEMLKSTSTSEYIKQQIYEAIIERANDPDLKIFDNPDLKDGKLTKAN